MAFKRNGRKRKALLRLPHMTARAASLASARFPVAAGLILVIALLSNFAAQDVYVPNEADFVWFIAALYGGAAASVAARIAVEARGGGKAGQSLAPVISAVAIGLPIWFGAALDVFAPALILAATLAVPLAPYVFQRDGIRFWAFTLWTGVGVTLAFLSVLLFTLGLSAILEMIRFLFEIGLSSNAYEHIYVTAFSLVGPLFALGRIPADFDDAALPLGEERLVSGVRLLFDWVAAPLALVTALVLHLYAAKIIVTGELPKNEIGWIVTFFTILVLSLRIAVEPFVEGGAVATRLFARAWAWVLCVPLALLVYAVALRIGAEGVTLQRYYLALGAIAGLVTVAAQAIPRLSGDIRFLAGVPVALLALSAFGPWGAVDTVGRSQAGLIRSAFLEEDGSTLRVDGLGEAEGWVLASRIRALDEAEELDRLADILTPDQREVLETALAERPEDAGELFLAELGLAQPPLPRDIRSMTAAASVPLDLGGYDIALLERFVTGADQPQPQADVSSGVGAVIDGGMLRLSVAGAQAAFDLAAAVAGLPEDVFSTDPQALAPPVLELESEDGRRIRVRLAQLVVDPDTDRIVSATMTILLRARDWPAGLGQAGTGSLGGDAAIAGEAEPGGAVGQRPR